MTRRRFRLNEEIWFQAFFECLMDAFEEYSGGDDKAALRALGEADRIWCSTAGEERLRRGRGRPSGSKNKTTRSQRISKLDADMLWVMARYAEQYGISAPETLVKRIQRDRPDIRIGQSRVADVKRLARKARAAKN